MAGDDDVLVDAFPPRRQVEMSDPDFTIRVVTFEDLLDLQLEPRGPGESARWRTPNALHAQVSESCESYLCPIFRNGIDDGGRPSYTCWLYYRSACEERAELCLLSVPATSFRTYPAVTSAVALNQLVGMLMDGIATGAKLEKII
jgi:hypothetical protein